MKVFLGIIANYFKLFYMNYLYIKIEKSDRFEIKMKNWWKFVIETNGIIIKRKAKCE